MAETIRFAVEKEEKIQEESLLMDKDFVVDLVRNYLSFLSNNVMLRGEQFPYLAGRLPRSSLKV